MSKYVWLKDVGQVKKPTKIYISFSKINFEGNK